MDEKIKAVLAGCGGISHTWLKAAREIQELEIVGLVDLVESAAHQQATEYGLSGAKIGTTLREIIHSTRPDIVFDCTIPVSHSSVVCEALQQGCHVLGEKPMADSLENAHRMIEAAKTAGKLYAVTQNYRYNADIRRLEKFIRSGVLGPLTTVNCDFYIGAHFGGFRDLMQHVLLLDMAIHTFDAARFLSGSDPVSVYCKEWNPAGSWYAHGASVSAIFEMTNGVTFNYRGSWCAEGLRTPWNSEWRLIGQNGTVCWNGEQEFRAEAVAKPGGFFSEMQSLQLPAWTEPEKTGGHAAVLREFIQCVRAGGTPETVCTDNIRSLAMVFAAIDSAEKGLPVPISL